MKKFAIPQGNYYAPGCCLIVKIMYNPRMKKSNACINACYPHFPMTTFSSSISQKENNHEPPLPAK